MAPEQIEGQEADARSDLFAFGAMFYGSLQANLVIVPQRAAADFLHFCERNPKPCPLLEVTPPRFRTTSWRTSSREDYSCP